MTIDGHQAIVKVHLVGSWYFVDDCSVDADALAAHMELRRDDTAAAAAAAALASLVDYLHIDDTVDVAVIGLGHYCCPDYTAVVHLIDLRKEVDCDYYSRAVDPLEKKD
jgi:hypothetical protein